MICPNCHRDMTARECGLVEHRQVRAHFLLHGPDAAPTGARGYSRAASRGIGIAKQYAHITNHPPGQRECVKCHKVKSTAKFWRGEVLRASCNSCAFKAKGGRRTNSPAKAQRRRENEEATVYWEAQAAAHR